jgi:hypothetical protein
VRAGGESIGGQHDYSVAPSLRSDRWFVGTGFSGSDVLPGLVGYEWDAVTPGCRTPPLTVLFHFAGPPAPADAVRFTAPSGALVFSAGSLSFALGLDDYRWHVDVPPTGDPRLEAFVRNAFADLIRPAAPLAVRTAVGRTSVTIAVRHTPDPRIETVKVYRARATSPLARGSRGMHLVCRTLSRSCVDRAPPGRRLRYVVVVHDRWGPRRRL